MWTLKCLSALKQSGGKNKAFSWQQTKDASCSGEAC